MRVIFESIFDILYLVGVIYIGLFLLKKGKDKTSKMYGWMALILGVGDSFHLIPRIFSLLSAGPNGDLSAAFIKYQVPLGFGKAITSITMTFFYVLLYFIWMNYYNKRNNKLITASILFLASIRIIISLHPANLWLVHSQPLSWAIYRNIPFSIMGIIIILLFFKQRTAINNDPFKNMWLAITLSFLFYIPVVLWSDINQNIGLLMIPKTLSYVWIVMMGYKYNRLLGI